VAAASSVPMILGGGIVARIMAETSVPIGIAYAVDLAAAAAGALLPLAMLGPLDGVSSLLVLAGLPALTAAFVEGPKLGRRNALALAGMLGAFALVNNHWPAGLQPR